MDKYTKIIFSLFDQKCKKFHEMDKSTKKIFFHFT